LGVAVFYAVQRIDWRPRKKREKWEEVESEEPEIEFKVESKAELDNFPAIYSKSVMLVSDYTGLSMAPIQTIREYLSVVTGSLEAVHFELFDALSMMYERWLYGIPLEPKLGEARGLLEGLEELLPDEG